MGDLPKKKVKENEYRGECIRSRWSLASVVGDTFLLIKLTTKNFTELPLACYQPNVIENKIAWT